MMITLNSCSHEFVFVIQERVSAKNPPEFYLSKLKVYLDPSASKSAKVREIAVNMPNIEHLFTLYYALYK